MFLRVLHLVALVGLGTALFIARIQAPPAFAAEFPDVIFHRGKIITVDREFSIAEAFAIKGDRIVFVGTSEDAAQLAGPKTQVIDLQGKTVLPGLIDSHSHPPSAAIYEFDHEVPSMETIQDVLDYIEQRTRVVPEGQWIVIQQVFVTRLKDRRFPTRQELDRVAPGIP